MASLISFLCLFDMRGGGYRTKRSEINSLGMVTPWPESNKINGYIRQDVSGDEF